MGVNDAERRCTIPVGYVTLPMFSSQRQRGLIGFGRARRQDRLKESADDTVIPA